MAESEPRTDGLYQSLRRLGDTVLAIVQNRLELVGVELREEKYRVIEALVVAGMLVFLSVLAVVFLTLTVVAIFWEYRVYILAGFGLLYSSGTVFLLFALKKRMQSWPTPFGTTIEEIKKDRECLLPRK